MNTFAKMGAKIGAIAAVSTAALAAGTALAQVAPAADHAAAEAAVAERIEKLEALGDIMDGQVKAMVMGRADADPAVIEEMRVLADEIWPLFDVDTSSFDDIETQSRDNIWQSHDAFLDKAATLDVTLVALKEAAGSGDRRALAMAARDVGNACGACHDAHKNE